MGTSKCIRSQRLLHYIQIIISVFNFHRFVLFDLEADLSLRNEQLILSTGPEWIIQGDTRETDEF